MALYVQDAHPIREAMGVRAPGRGAGLRGGVAGRQPAGARGDGPHGRLRRHHRAHRRRARGSSTCWTRNPARLASLFSTLDDLAPGRILAGLGAWWDPLAAKVGIARDRPLRVMREVVEAVRALLRCDGPVTYDGRLRAPRRRRARLRPPGAPGQAGPALHRGDRHADDGAGGRDRRRRRAQLPGVARLQRAGAGGAGRGRRPGRAHPRRRRPAPAGGVLARRRPRRRARRRPPAGHPVPGPAAAHHGGVRRARRRCSTRSARC